MRRPSYPLTWGRVDGTYSSALIVASGPSVSGVNVKNITPLPGMALIAVNGTGRQLVNASHWFTLDPSTANREIMERRPEGRVAYAAVYPHFEPSELENRYVTFLQRLLGDGPRGAHLGLSEDPAFIATGNSAYGALGLAWHFGARRIAILGLDGSLDGYWYGKGGPRGSFDHLPELFESTLPQLRRRGVQVVNGSPDSTVACFPRMHPADAVAWLFGGGT